MASLSRLRTALLAALNPAGFQNAEQELFDQLVSHTQQLLNLGDVGPRNPQEQRELESGAHSLT
jgi:nuclear pore complex protein Nup205